MRFIKSLQFMTALLTLFVSIQGMASDTCTYAEYYAARPDVAAAGLDAYDHWLQYGWREGMCVPEKNPEVCTYAKYYADRPDVAAAGLDAYFHWIQWGRAEGACIPYNYHSCSYAEYLAQRPDVAAAGLDPYFHYQNWGKKEAMCIPIAPPSQISKQSR